MRIKQVTDPTEVLKGAELFDSLPTETGASRFLNSTNHHLLFAYDDTDRPVGMISGVETTHPDKGTEMFLYELGVAPAARRRGIATTLVEALAKLARERGCYGMWVATDLDNDAALATYRRAGANEESAVIMLSWNFPL